MATTPGLALLEDDAFFRIRENGDGRALEGHDINYSTDSDGNVVDDDLEAVVTDAGIDTNQLNDGSVSAQKLEVNAIRVFSNYGATVTIDYDGMEILDGRLVIKDHSGSVVIRGGAGFDNAWADFITTGLYNSDMGNGPSGGDGSTLSATNALPYWTGPTLVTGTPTVVWASDAGSPSGYSVKATMPGTASEEFYLEQIVPIGADRGGFGGVAPRATFYAGALNTNEIQGRIAIQFLKADQATPTGTEVTLTKSLAAAGGATVVVPNSTFVATLASAPTDAAYVRLRVGAKRLANPGASDTIYLSNTRLDPIALVYLLGDGSGLYRPGSISQEDSTGVAIRPGGLATRHWSVGFLGEMTTRGARLYGDRMTLLSLTANQNNWADAYAGGSPVHTYHLYDNSYIIVTVSGAASWNVTGFSATGFTSGQRFTMVVVGGSMVLKYKSASSSAGNRITAGSGADVTVRDGGAVDIIYDADADSTNPFRVVAP